MSKIGWRWWGVSKTGSLLSFTGDKTNPWPTDEAFHAECTKSGYMSGQYVHAQHESEARGIKVQQARTLEEAKQIALVEVPMEVCPLCKNPRRHKIASLECTCGIYVFKWSEDADALPYAGYRRQCDVFGCVEWWGNATEHELGYRVEYAQIRAIWAMGKGAHVHPAYEIDRVRQKQDLIDRYEPDYDESEDNQ
jgi:hypothetical protein